MAIDGRVLCPVTAPRVRVRVRARVRSGLRTVMIGRTSGQNGGAGLHSRCCQFVHLRIEFEVKLIIIIKLASVPWE